MPNYMLLAALTAGVITLAPPLHPMCEEVGYELLAARQQGHITNAQASKVFERCQINFPPMYP